MSPKRRLGWPQKMTQGWKAIKMNFLNLPQVRSVAHLPELRAEALGENVLEELQPRVLHEVRVRERLVGDVNFVLLGARQPFGEDVGVSERILSDRRDEEHRNRRQSALVELLRENFEEIVNDAGRIAGNQHGAVVAQSQNWKKIKKEF